MASLALSPPVLLLLVCEVWSGGICQALSHYYRAIGKTAHMKRLLDWQKYACLAPHV